MNTRIVHLFFRNSMHAGSSITGVGLEATQEFLHSDTIWAAICNIWSQIGCVEGIRFNEFLETFASGQPLFKISSAFPFDGNGKTYWLPKPCILPRQLSEKGEGEECILNREKIGLVKALKQMRFIDLDTFSKWIQFQEISIDEDIKCQRINTLRPQVTVDRTAMRSNLYQSGVTYFQNVDFDRLSGLFFLLQVCDDQVFRALQHVFQVIHEVSGFGGNIHTGSGQLIKEPIITETGDNWSDIFNEDVENKNAHCLLSLYYPNAKEWEEFMIDDALVAYDLIPRNGWTGSLSTTIQSKRCSVMMIGEGSVMRTAAQGALAVVTPEETGKVKKWKGRHSVYRYGYAMSVPMKISELE